MPHHVNGRGTEECRIRPDLELVPPRLAYLKGRERYEKLGGREPVGLFELALGFCKYVARIQVNEPDLQLVVTLCVCYLQV